MTCIEKANREKLEYLQTNSGEEFISTILKNFYNKRSITISYTILYIYKKNEMAK